MTRPSCRLGMLFEIRKHFLTETMLVTKIMNIVEKQMHSLQRSEFKTTKIPLV